jgi:hypothetical protein
MTHKVFLWAVLVVVFSSGCSLNPWGADYSCRGYPKGVSCKSAREVYELTNYRDSLETKDDKDAQTGQSVQDNGDNGCAECGK